MREVGGRTKMLRRIGRQGKCVTGRKRKNKLSRRWKKDSDRQHREETWQIHQRDQESTLVPMTDLNNLAHIYIQLLPHSKNVWVQNPGWLRVSVWSLHVCQWVFPRYFVFFPIGKPISILSIFIHTSIIRYPLIHICKHVEQLNHMNYTVCKHHLQMAIVPYSTA